MDKPRPKLLIVEDEEALANVLFNKFERSGFEVHRSSTGRQAMDAMDADSFDIILLDICMPGMDGIAVLAEKGKSLKGKSVVYVLTNIGDEKKLCEARELGAKECLVKANISLSDLVEKVKKEVGMSI